MITYHPTRHPSSKLRTSTLLLGVCTLWSSFGPLVPTTRGQGAPGSTDQSFNAPALSGGKTVSGGIISGISFRPAVQALAAQPDGRVLIGGIFGGVGGLGTLTSRA